MMGLVLAGALAMSSPLTLIDEPLQFDMAPRVSLSLPSTAGGPLPAVLGFFWVGLGQVVNGEPVKGILIFLSAGLLGGVGLGLAQVGPDSGPTSATYIGLGMLGAFTVLYAWSIWDAWNGGWSDEHEVDVGASAGMGFLGAGVYRP